MEFIARARTNQTNRRILERLPSFGLKDCWLVSGALFQSVWNDLTGRAPGYGIVDYDVIYFDDSDLSWEAENKTIKSLSEGFKDLSARIEVRNQARVHLWYEEKYGLPYAALTHSCESIDRYLAVASMVGLQPNLTGEIELYAPKGLDDIKSLYIRPNPSQNFCCVAYGRKSKRWKAHWPEVVCLSDEAN